MWCIIHSSTGSTSFPSFGTAEDIPAVGDYDGDGRADYAARRTSDKYWRIRYSSDGSSLHNVQWGLSTDKAVQGRYNDSGNSDAKTDITVWRPSNGVWYILRSSDSSLRAQQWRMDGDIPVPAN